MVFINMATRSITRSINLYYEDWRVPLTILLLMAFCSLANIFKKKISKQKVHDKKLQEEDNETSNSEESGKENSLKRTKQRKKPETNISLLVVNLLIPGLISCFMLFAQYFTSSDLMVRWSGNTGPELSLLVLLLSFVTALLNAASIKNFICFTKKDDNKTESCVLKVKILNSSVLK